MAASKLKTVKQVIWLFKSGMQKEQVVSLTAPFDALLVSQLLAPLPETERGRGALVTGLCRAGSSGSGWMGHPIRAAGRATHADGGGGFWPDAAVLSEGGCRWRWSVCG